MFLTLFIKIVKDGKPRPPHSAVEGIADFMLMLFLLYWGGFYK